MPNAVVKKKKKKKLLLEGEAEQCLYVLHEYTIRRGQAKILTFRLHSVAEYVYVNCLSQNPELIYVLYQVQT